MHKRKHARKHKPDLYAPSLDFTGKETKDQKEALKKSQQDYESKLAELRAEIEKYDSKMEDLHTENLYLESYSRRENIKFMNIKEEPSTNGNENTEDILRNFLERSGLPGRKKR